MKKEHSPKNKVRHFASVEHLNPEAVAAFVDNELSPAAAHRAKIHLVHCPECREEIHRQRRAAERRRDGNNSDMRPSSDLIAKLQSIAACCPDGPTAEEVPLSPQSLLDKLDGVARNIYKTTKTLREARNEALRQYDR
ncbi:anti-sigma factor [Corynebacterium diphtheriae]|nr:anti-sigma factor [Corynebacterium diphtheriae]